jgi:DNA-binding response OmpR family regulator
MTVTSVDVLVVDDNEALLDLATRTLSRAGISVAAAATFEQLETMLPGLEVRLILMDVQMPELFGDDVGAILRSRGVAAKIYLYSSLDPDELGTLARNAGLDGFLSKSAGIGHLVDEVHRLLARSREA